MKIADVDKRMRTPAVRQRNSARLIALALSAGLLAAAPGVAASAESLPSLGALTFQEPLQHQQAGKAEEIARLFAAASYSLSAVRRSRQVPRLFVTQVPPDLAQLSIAAKKQLFVALLLPSVIKANAALSAQRQALETLLAKQDQGESLSGAEADWLKRLADSYQVTQGDWAELQSRVDGVPPSLVIAQGIDESAWGTSRFAREGNALFGEHMPPHGKGRYIESRQGGVKVAAFDSIAAGVRGYLHNLNTARAYAKLRAIRAKARDRQEVPSGYDMSFGLESYSGRGSTYVKDLQIVMKRNRLADYDRAALAPGGAVLIAPMR